MKYYILYLCLKQEINELTKLMYDSSMYKKRIRKTTK